jgi:hypothetical protein
VKLKRKINLAKWLKNQKNEDKKWHKETNFWLNSKIKKNNNFYKKIERKKLEIKRMKIKLEKQICSKLGCNDEIKKKKKLL